MTDAELIARLRDEHVAASRTEAADRIEALIAELDEAMQLIETLSNMNGGLSRDMYRTKLLLAALLDAAEKVINSYWNSTDGVITGIYDLEAALARVKGETK